jgi:hypothetical protein
MSPALNRQWITDAQISMYISSAELKVSASLSKQDVPKHTEPLYPVSI